MAIILKDNNAAFLHIPKTGGTWVRHQLETTGLIKKILHGNDCEPQFGFNTIHNIPIYDTDFNKTKVVFCFVRNPLDWYRSYFSYRRLTPWDVHTMLDKQCESDSFNTFIERVIEHYPKGYLTRLYSLFSNYCTHVGRMEDLRYDLVRFLRASTDSLSVDSISYEKINNTGSSVLTYRPELAKRIHEIEFSIFQKYQYPQPATKAENETLS